MYWPENVKFNVKWFHVIDYFVCWTSVNQFLRISVDKNDCIGKLGGRSSYERAQSATDFKTLLLHTVLKQF